MPGRQQAILSATLSQCCQPQCPHLHCFLLNDLGIAGAHTQNLFLHRGERLDGRALINPDGLFTNKALVSDADLWRSNDRIQRLDYCKVKIGGIFSVKPPGLPKEGQKTGERVNDRR